MATKNPQMTAGPGSAPAAAKPATGLRSGWDQVKALALGFMPSWLQKIIEKGLLKAFLLVVLVVVVAPVVLAFLAALWLKLLGDIDSTIVTAARNAYVKVIQEGFAVEDVVTRSHALLDYVFFFSHDLKPRANPIESLALNLQRGQRAAIHVRRLYPVAPNSVAAPCELPSNAGQIEMIEVQLGGQLLGPALSQGEKIEFEVNELWWNENSRKIYTKDLAQTLSFRLTNAALQWTCAYVHVEGAVHVYKNVYPVRAAAQ